jgi:hypothetical protein
MAEQEEVRVRLILDSNAKGATEEFKKHVDSAGVAAKAAGASSSSGMTAFAVAAGGVLGHLAEKAFELTKKAFEAPIEAFMESQAQVKALAGSFALIDQGGNSFQALKEYAADVKDELEDMGMALGVADDELVSVFNNIIERGGRSVESAQALTEQMALAGRAVPGGARGLSEAMEQVQMGMVRAKNPIVGMISATGLLKGNAKQVAAEMQKMDVAKQMELAEKAVGKMADKMKDAPMSFKEAKTSLEILFSNLLENAGESMTAGLTKSILEFRAKFVDSKGEATDLTTSLMDGAKKFGEFLSNAFSAVQPFIQGFSDGIAIAGEEFKIIWGDGKDAWELFRDTAQFVGQMLGIAVKMFAAGIGAVIVAIRETVNFLAVAVGRLLVSASQMPGMKEDTSTELGNAGVTAMQFGVAGEQKDLLAKMRSVGGGDFGDLRKQYAESVVGTMGDEGAALAQIEEAAAARRNAQQNIDEAQKALMQGQASFYIESFKKASDAHDEAAKENIARFLVANQGMANSIRDLGPEVLGGAVKDFVGTLKNIGAGDLAKQIGGGMKLKMGLPDKTPINQTFTGPINIKQDFRDQDPDRIAVAFKQDLGRAASSRLQSRLSSPFGM